MRARLMPLVLAAAACGDAGPDPAADARAYSEALTLTASDPAAAGARCADIEARGPRAGCVWAVAEAMGGSAPEEAAALCEQLRSFRQSECFFNLARASGDWTWCERAGDYARDCERHLFVPDLEAWLSAPMEPGQMEEEILEHLPRLGLDLDHDITWTEIYKVALGRHHPVDSRLCDPVTQPELRESCREVAFAYHAYYLDNLLDKGDLYCEGGPPHRFAELVDPRFLELTARWRAEGRCVPGTEPQRAPKGPPRK